MQTLSEVGADFLQTAECTRKFGDAAPGKQKVISHQCLRLEICSPVLTAGRFRKALSCILLRTRSAFYVTMVMRWWRNARGVSSKVMTERSAEDSDRSKERILRRAGTPEGKVVQKFGNGECRREASLSACIVLGNQRR